MKPRFEKSAADKKMDKKSGKEGSRADKKEDSRKGKRK